MRALSGYIVEPAKALAHPLASLKTPILLVHGTQDTRVPEEKTLDAMKALKGAGYHPVLKEFPMGHQITEESLGAVSKFLQDVFAISERQNN
jgi:predicted esterase